MGHWIWKPWQESIDLAMDLYGKYSSKDVAAALFTSGLWLPNISSSIKHLWCTAVFCDMKPASFSRVSAMGNYGQFCDFLTSLSAIIPSFAMLEDFVPELDWGDVKFHFKGNRYRIFYGGDLSDTYDYMTLFQILYESIDHSLVETTNRSPLGELGGLLRLQEGIIASISSQPAAKDMDVEPGGLSIPSEPFWREATVAHDSFPWVTMAGPDLCTQYSVPLGNSPSDISSEEAFVNSWSDGRILPAMFVVIAGNHYPILPRRSLGVLFDSWGEILKGHKASLPATDRSVDLGATAGFCQYVRQRFPESDTLFFVSALSKEEKPHEIVFPTSIVAKDRLVLFYLLPPATDSDATSGRLAEITPQVNDALALLLSAPTQLISRHRSTRIELRPGTSVGTVTPTVILLIPQATTSPLSVDRPEGLSGRVEFMDSMVAVLDEISSTEELSDFIEYLDSIENSSMSPMSSLLDKFASFRDAHGVLIAGASTPDLVMLDPHWGSQFRFESLRRFWRLYPRMDFFGHPGSWQILEEGEGERKRLRLVERNRFGFALYCEIGDTIVFISAPVDLMSSSQIEIASLLTECLEDGLFKYRDQITKHHIFGEYDVVRILAFPRALVEADPTLEHLLSLDPGAKPWCSDAQRLEDRAIGVRIVYNDEAVQSLFLTVRDRSAEIGLVLDILGRLDTLSPDSEMQGLVALLEKAKSGKPRYKLIAAQKSAAFPEFARSCSPIPRDFKLARKRLARIARDIGVNEGRYALQEAKARLGALRKAMVAEIDEAVSVFEFADSIAHLVGWADAVIDQREHNDAVIHGSLAHDVDYSRVDRYSANEREFIRGYRCHRYLIEKFVQLQPTGQEVLSEERARYLLALIDLLFEIHEASDAIHYEFGPVGLQIDSDFLVEVQYNEEMTTNLAIFEEERSRLRLGTIGNAADSLEHGAPSAKWMSELDSAFHSDHGFRFTTLVSTLAMLSCWPEYHTGTMEASTYFASQGEIVAAARDAIENLELAEVDRVLEFLTLRSGDLLRITGDSCSCDDLPVWEHKKRFMRYSIRPLIRVEEGYLWGPFSVRSSGIVWSGSLSLGTLPTDIGKSRVREVMARWKQTLDDRVTDQAAGIVGRFTTNVLSNARLHRLDKRGGHPESLGDYDVLAYLPENHAILNIECKNILPAFCLKDTKTLRETIFGKPGKGKGHFDQIERRQDYLLNHWSSVAEFLDWPLTSPSPPRILSLYVTPRSYWWTRFPPQKMETAFVQLELLEVFIRDLRS